MVDLSESEADEARTSLKLKGLFHPFIGVTAITSVPSQINTAVLKLQAKRLSPF